ncbi:methyltransferase domain-containing protein [Candidatus Woesearchaeota archaeon]|nr:methyltransferase domain-containing protein [Candidatus Woesearchaeota archaeon]
MFNKNLYNMYGLGMRILGYESGISRFIDNLNLKCQTNSKILDIGCGTGVIGLQLITKFPKSTLMATDIQENFLHELITNTKKRGINNQKISVGISNIATPTKVMLLDGSSVSLNRESFDIVSVGATIGYSKDPKKTIRALLGLIKPGGYFINLEMNEKFIGRWTSSRYHYSNISLTEMKQIIENEGHNVSVLPISVKYFPTNLTRVGILVQKTYD